jgi:site-specific recombinase XerD
LIDVLGLGDFSLLDEKPQRPFDAYFRHWLDTYVKAHCKPSTVYVYEDAFRLYLLPTFRRKDIGTVTREEVKTLIYGILARGKSRSTANNALAPLRAMFSHAVEDAHVDRNPCLRIMRRSRKEEGAQQQKATFLTREELGVLLRTCQEHFPQRYPFVSLLALPASALARPAPYSGATATSPAGSLRHGATWRTTG